ncbi:ATP synthase subunit H-domain-containing protein, partial [Cryomyces antarcticus]
MANGWSLLIGLVFIAVFCVVAWFASPKGENQTVWRSTLILSAWSCYLMWAITFLAQWHPLITPKRGDLRPGLINHEGPSG